MEFKASKMKHLGYKNCNVPLTLIGNELECTNNEIDSEEN